SSATSSSSSDTSLTGSSKPSLSSMILGTLIGMQQQQSGSDTSSSGDSSSSSSDAVQSLFTAMDSDGDGTVSQSELEGYIEQQGGTQSEADSLYSMLDPSGSSSGISESTLAGDAPQGPPSGGPPPGGMPPGG